MSQLKKGAEGHIAYASRQTNRAEQSYAAPEDEILALFWATKQFRCYLHDWKFVDRTNHVALTYLRIFADQNSQLLRWSVKLLQLHFAVEHQTGNKMVHVGALSRHVGTKIQGGALEKEDVLREEAKEALCLKHILGTYQIKNEFFVHDDTVLYKRNSSGDHLLIVS